VRCGWHVTPKLFAPHLSKNGRVWGIVEMQDYKEFQRPESQGGLWYIAQKIKVMEIMGVK